MKIWFPWLLASIWLMAVGLGMGGLLVYDFTPGKDTSIPASWPAQSKIVRLPGQTTLVMFAHPDCPCTRASLGELAELMAHSQNKVSAYVLFLHPKGSSEGWLHTDLWSSAQAIPGVTVQADGEGKEAGYFRVTTSGQVVLYDAENRLIFHGGITPSRGHYGDNDGISIILKLLNHEKTAETATPVFGCSLLDPKLEDIPEVSACTR